jgi:hypothetical protein
MGAAARKVASRVRTREFNADTSTMTAAELSGAIADTRATFEAKGWV